MLVGPPHPISNIRPIKFYVPADETPAERTYRELREEAVAKDHEFWLNNNMHFEQGKMDFERKAIQEKGQCTIDDLSEYFAKYQTDSYDRHLAYNRYVWRRNLQMIWPSLCAWFQEIRRRRRRKMAAYAKHSEQGYFDQQADSGSVVAERIQSNSVDGIVAASGNVKIDNTAETNANTASALDGKVDRRAEKIKSYY
ncbi:hypothetical protein GGI25_003563 [Coemansia spiralis]|uniref:Apoptogenic protein 1 n=2 Tax=Coemansia TaxID=4863 RepID=A0A9W8G632_9FUNG|nr:hypothetical protein EDC05_003597 [Coemansia umbellata]KAJ2621304.1 hypothetical protein GGI26_004278 [Coemansia sp. RSA 1358]KAJ2676413.1 hypothetical protein GGI25_003563 [Coemansia spiralis]